MNKGNKVNYFKVGAYTLGVVLVIGAIILAMCITRIPSGFLGLVYSPNNGLKEQTLSQGWKMVAPFDKVVKYPIRLQTVEYKDIQVATKDGKGVTMDFAYNYQIDPTKATDIFNTFGPISVEEIENSYLRTRLRDAARKEVAKYTVIDVYGQKSAEVGVSVQDKYADDVKPLGFQVTNITVGVPQPDAATQQSIDERIVASQNLEKKTIEKQIATQEAERLAIEAQGKADALVIEATSQAEANELLRDSLSNEVILSKLADKWNGVQSFVQGGDTSPILDMRGFEGLGKEEKTETVPTP